MPRRSYCIKASIRRPHTPTNSFTTPDLCAAYRFPKVTAKRPGVLGIIELGGGYVPSDIGAAFSAWSLPTPLLNDVGIQGASNSPGGDADGEVALDIEVAAAACSYMTGIPTVVKTYFAPNTDTGFVAAIRQAVTDKVDAISISWGCYDRDTEVLTKEGWRYFSEIRGDESIATLNPDTRKLEYRAIQQVHRYPYKGQMHRYQGRCTDLMVTPNHQMYVARNNWDRAKLVPSEDVFESDWNLVPKTADWDGEEVENVEVAGRTVRADLWLEFLGYFLSEGWASIGNTHHKERTFIENRTRLKNRRRLAAGTYALSTPNDPREAVTATYVAKAFDEVTYRVEISQLKEENIAKIQACLDRLPFKFNRGNGKWRCNDRALCAELTVFGKAHEKHLPQWTKHLCSRQLRILYDALMVGDGHRNGLGKQAYYTSSRQLADDVQELLLKIGYVGSVRTIDRRGHRNDAGVTRHIEYRVNIKEKYKTERMTRRSVVDYDDFVYCLTVPNHIMYVRRHGMPAWCGNSPESSWPVSSIRAMHNAFAFARSKRIPVFAASGDNDSGDGASGVNVDYPSSDPFVVGCGGTRKSAALESVWNDGQNGTGGGYSVLFGKQKFQLGAPTPKGSGRMVPDVAADADPATGYDIYLNGQWQVIGGTSAVAPLYAGLAAALASAGRLTRLLPDFFWAIPGSFTDVIIGNNGRYVAEAGPDPCTGLGVVNGSALLLAMPVK